LADVKVGGFGQDRATFWAKRRTGAITAIYDRVCRPDPRAALLRRPRRGCTSTVNLDFATYHANYYGAFVFDPDA
jgi:hypothetical protein